MKNKNIDKLYEEIPCSRDDIAIELSNCGFAKTILMLLVIFGHSLAFWSEGWITEIPVIYKSTLLKDIYLWINSIHTYSFVLISGFIFAYKMVTGGYNKYSELIKKKTLRLIVPYYFLAAVWVAPVDYILFTPDIFPVIRKYFFGINPSQLWFLWMLFDVFVIVWPLWRIISRPKLGWLVSFLLFCIGKLGSRFATNYFCIYTACQYFVFFYVGIRLYIGEFRIIKEWWFWLFVHSATFIAYLCLLPKPGLKGELLRIGVLLPMHIAGSIFAFLCLTSVGSHIRWNDSKIFKTFTKHSMPLYLFHQQIVYFSVIWLNGRINPWIHAGVNFIVAFAGSFIISWILMRWKPTRVLIGEE